MFVTKKILEDCKINNAYLDLFNNLYPDGEEFSNMLGNEEIPNGFFHWAFLYLPLTDEEKEKYMARVQIKNSQDVYNSRNIENCNHVFSSRNCTNSSYVRESITVNDSTLVVGGNRVTRSEQVYDSKKVEKSDNSLEILSGAVFKTECYKKGYFHAQDLASQTCIDCLNPQENDIVFDLCAAPGGKSFTIAEKMNNKGKVYSFDLYEHKIKLINDGAKRLDITIIDAQIGDAAAFNPDLPKADKVLCDVPCAGLGVIRRKPEIKYKDFGFVDKLCELQYNILNNASLYVKENGVLGIAMGTSEAGGYIDADGNITGWLNELAFVPVDFNEDAMVDEWSGDYGCGVKYFSQDGVIKLAPYAGIELDESLSPAEKLKVVQGLMEKGDQNAADIYDTIGVYFGYALAYYSEFYDIKHVLIMGRVTSGQGGQILLSRAQEVLDKEFPELASKMELHIPDEKSRRVGQSVAAASLPRIK